MKRFFLLVCLLVPQFYLASICWASESDLTFLLLGQSNMAGQGKVSELADSMKSMPQNVNFFLNGSLVKLSTQQKFGPEVSFARRIAQVHPAKTINLIKFAPGGSLMKDWLKGGYHYQTLSKQLAKIRKTQSIDVRGVLWMQGERDTKSFESAKNYKVNLERFILTIRRDLAKPNLPFVIAQISFPEAYRPAVTPVKLAQQKIPAELPSVSSFSTGMLQKNPDKVHFSSKGQIELGQLFADYFLPNHAQRNEHALVKR